MDSTAGAPHTAGRGVATGAPSAQGTPSTHNDSSIQAAERLLADMRAEIGRADTKASVLIGAIGVSGGTVLGRTGSTTGADTVALGLGWGGFLAWSLALGFLIFATAPRYRRSTWEPGRPLSYFLDVRRAARSGRLPDALRLTEEDRLTGLVTSLDATSTIVAAKHRWIRAGSVCFALGAIPLLAVVFTGG